LLLDVREASVNVAPEISAAGDLASKVGILGGAVILVALGIAIAIATRFPEILKQFREFVKDWQEWSLKRRALQHRISQESEMFRLEIEEKRRQIVRREDRS
jgi:hypothetical protein